jgi:tRNA(Ile)-lysidine synthase
VLLHLLRGAGLPGVAGMQVEARLPVPWWEAEPGADLLIWRPLLPEPRAVIRAYAASVGLAPIDDPSNENLDYRRNAIRHQAMPTLEGIVPGATAALARFAGLAADDEAALSAITDAVLASAVAEASELRRDVVMIQPVAVRRRIVRRWVRDGCGLTSMTAERTDAMLDLLANGEPGRRLEIGEGMTVTVTRTGLRLDGPDRGMGGASGEGDDDGDETGATGQRRRAHPDR